MAHEIEYRSDRKTNSFTFIGDRSLIWHGRGQQGHATWSAEQWRQNANQDFRVRKIPLVAVPGLEGDAIPIASHEALIREDNGAVLSVVTPEWQPAQNDDAYAFLDPFIKEGFCSYNTAGTLYDGKRCFVLVKTREGFQLPGGDATEGYIFVQISHEYGLADLALPVSIRVVCENTRRFALQRKSKEQIDAGKFVHRAKTAFSVDKAHALIEAYKLGLGEYAEQAKFLASKIASAEQVRAYVNKVFKLEELKDGTASEIAKRRDHNERVVSKLLATVDTQPGANLSPGTWWQAYNAVSFFEDHGRWIGKDEPLSSKLIGASADRKQAALNVALELAA